MPQSLHPQTIHDDSQIRIDTDSSALLLSEPLDIGKWFESYVYESPELDSADGIQNSDGFFYSEGESQRDEPKHQFFDVPSSDGHDSASLNRDIAVSGQLNSGLHQACSISVNRETHAEEEGGDHAAFHGTNEDKKTTQEAAFKGKRSRDTEKENQSSESGFVSVKKVRNFTAGVESVKQRGGFFDREEEDGMWKVASEAAPPRSFSDPITDVGKWYCPRNKKPRIDRPPLKQLRLEQCRGKQTVTKFL